MLGLSAYVPSSTCTKPPAVTVSMAAWMVFLASA